MTAAQILVVDDESDIRDLLQEILSEEGYQVRAAADAAQARNLRSSASPDLVLLDIWMPDTDGITLLREWSDSGTLEFPVVMMSGHGTVDTAVEATRLGAVDFIEKPLSLAKLLRTVERALGSGRQPQSEAARRLVPRLVAPIGKSRVMRQLREQVQRVAPHDTNVLIAGEAGTGREAFGRYLHSLSARSAAPFVPLVAASLTEENALASLLGREVDGEVTPGYFDKASGGILFINEAEDLCEGAQRALLGALETREYVRVGGTAPVPLEVRFVTSVQPGAEQPGRSERLRRDLLSHLNVIPLRVPPLREYSEDVPDLLRYYVDKLIDQEGLPLRRFSVAAQNRLRNYPWPGNMSDLRNLVHRFLMLGNDEEISLAEVEEALALQAPVNVPLVKQDLLSMTLREAREHFERAYLEQQLALCGGKVGQLATRVGMERTHLYRKLRALEVDFGKGGSED
ncbi:MAG: sigma-54 dependent transcriptional regulator [Pseudomonadota bacterium]